MANVCACGCGELLPEGSIRQYKRGHKNRTAEPITETPDDIYPEDPPAFTIEDAARETPDDPEPKEQPEFKPKTQTKIKITAAIRRDVEGKLAFGFAVLGQTWSMVDPLCGNVLLDTGPDMAKKYTPIICQSPDVVKFITKTGNFVLYVEALMATWPLLQVIFAHHIAKTISVIPTVAQPSPEAYTVQ